MAAPYAWLITYDHIADYDEPAGTNCNAIGMTGPRNINPVLETVLRTAARIGRASWHGPEDVKWFRIFDDDGERYYSGVYVAVSDDPSGFEPLDDFGTPNAGATEIQYYNPATEEWEVL